MSTPPARTLLIEGWRFIPHSYAVLNQFQCLELLKIPGLQIFHRDVPYVRSRWLPVTGMFSPEEETAIRAIPAISDDAEADAVLRIAFPYNCAPSRHKRTFVFGTSEFLCVTKEYIAQNKPLPEMMIESDFVVLTPSQWSRDGFIRSGGDPERIVVIPLGVDPAIYHPLGALERESLRARRECSGFIFLSVGAMTANKGLPMLLKAFAAVSERHPHVRLVLKGLDALYSSKDMLLQQANELTPEEAARLEGRLSYIGETLNFQEMAQLYQVADAYVSPYSAEGFNMPCLEAAACGTVVICTQGGPTDDFTRPGFTLRVQSTMQSVQCIGGAPGTALKPDYEHLLHQMMTAVEQRGFCAQAREAGPAFVTGSFTWKHTVEKLINVLFPKQERSDQK
jgi:glycosyltransferase involved in cell wall biosynthesis